MQLGMSLYDTFNNLVNDCRLVLGHIGFELGDLSFRVLVNGRLRVLVLRLVLVEGQTVE